MHLSDKIKEVLKGNWGEKADALNCYAEIKFIDPLSDWACYIFALNPNDENEIDCLIKGQTIELCKWSLIDLGNCFNSEGERPKIDTEFRRTRASQLFKKLSEGR